MTAFQNPNQEPGTERRLLLAFVLTFLVIAITQPLIMKYAKRNQPPATPGQQAAPPAPAQAPVNPPPTAAIAPATKGQPLESTRAEIQRAWTKDVSSFGAVGPRGLADTCSALDPALWFFGLL